MSANVDAMVKEAIRAYKAGKKSEARSLLEKATELDQFSEQAWLWLSAVVDTDEDRRTCLENVMFINPNNEAARKGLDALEKNSGGAAKPKPAAKTGQPPTATSSSSSTFTPEEPSEEEYDQWMDRLNIQSDAKSSTSPFSSSAGLFDEDEFSDPFAQNTGFDDAFELPQDDEEADEFDSFSDDEADPFSEDISGGPFSAGSLEFDYDNKPAATSRPTATPPPVSSTSGGRSRPAAVISDEDDSAFFGGSDDIGDGFDDPDPSEYFDVIPAEIRPTRLPGRDERYPVLVMVLLVVLILANIAAAGMLVMNLSSG